MKVQLSFWNFTVISYVRLKRVCLFDSSRINIDSTLLRWMKIDSTLLLKLCAHWNFVKCVCENTILRWTSGDCDICEHGICYLDYINLRIIIIIGTIT